MDEDITIENHITSSILNDNLYQRLTVDSGLRSLTLRSLIILHVPCTEHTILLVYPFSILAVNGLVTVNLVVHQLVRESQTPLSSLSNGHSGQLHRMVSLLHILLLIVDSQIAGDIDTLLIVIIQLKSSTCSILESSLRRIIDVNFLLIYSSCQVTLSVRIACGQGILKVILSGIPLCILRLLSPYQCLQCSLGRLQQCIVRSYSSRIAAIVLGTYLQSNSVSLLISSFCRILVEQIRIGNLDTYIQDTIVVSKQLTTVTELLRRSNCQDFRCSTSLYNLRSKHVEALYISIYRVSI